MNAESTPIRDNLKSSISDAFHELTPVIENNSEKKKQKCFFTRVKREIFKSDESNESSSEEPMIRSQVHKSNKKRKRKGNEKKTNKRKFSTQNDSRYQNYSDDLVGDNENLSIDNKLQFSDCAFDKVTVNCVLEKNVGTVNGVNSSKDFTSKFCKNELSNESLSASDVMKWSDNSLMPQGNESYFCNLIKKKLFENAFNREVIKSQTSGWTQYEILNTQSHSLSVNESFHGLPSQVRQLYEEHKGIKELFTWQKECLNLDAVKQKKNLIYSLPTSGGKSLVAEILILRELLIHHKNVLYILPFVSIVQEKMRDFSQFALEFNFSLEEYAAGKGVIPPKKHRKKNSLMIATIEKALIVVNSLIEVNRLKELGLIVVDELHLLSEEGRGPILETLLIQVLHQKGEIQIIGMTATIGNLKEVADFLKAESYSGNFRPVQLLEYIKCRDKIYSVDWQSQDLIKEIRTLNTLNEEDTDGIAQLVQEIIPNDSVLIFCPTKKNCENIAALLAKFLSRNLTKYKAFEKMSLYRALISEMNEKICPVLEQTLPFGVAYHHSGLTAGERKLLEEAFRQGTLSLICCTSTLAAGVNLPAKRVILRSPYIGKDFISLSKYKQMVGRAGRMGFGSEGDSFLICQPIDLDKVKQLLSSQMDEATSRMDSESCKDLVLSSIGLGTATTRGTLRELFKHSLLHYQFSKLNKDTREIVDECIENLYSQGALIVKSKQSASLNEKSTSELKLNSLEGKESAKITNNSQLTVSRLGRAAMKGGLSLEAAHELYGELVRAQAGLVLFTNLHLLYLVTPYDLMTQIKPNFQIFFNVYMQLNAKDIHAARVIGITESVMAKLAVCDKPKNIKETVLNRFYISLIINELWNQKAVWDVAQLFQTLLLRGLNELIVESLTRLKLRLTTRLAEGEGIQRPPYQLPRGLVQTVMTSAATFVNSVLRFCEELEEFWFYKSLLSEFAPRLAHCCSPELLPLMDLPAVKKGRAKQLHDAGFKTLQMIARAQPADLVCALDHMPRNVAVQIVAAAKLLLKEKAENLREEADTVLEGLTEKFVPAII